MEKIEEIQDQFEKKLYDEFRPYGVLITAVLVGNMVLPSVEQAIQQKTQTKQEAEKMEYVVQREEFELRESRGQIRLLGNLLETILSHSVVLLTDSR